MTTMPTGVFPTVGTVLDDRYELIAEIGRGGFSVVYAGRDRTLDADIAVKLLVPPPASAHIARARMEREFRAVRRVSHPNIVRLFDFRVNEPWTYIVMERIDGQNLAQRVAGNGPVPADEVATIGAGVAAALGAAHALGILHRDVKPQNILLDSGGTPRLVDFGSARIDGHTLTRSTGLIGTIQYTAPEILRGVRADPRSDVYALGVTLFFALTGRLPEGASTYSAPQPRADGFRPRDVCTDVPEWLDVAVAEATRADPENRFPTGESLSDVLSKRANARRSTHAPAERCLICDEPEPFGVGLCPGCGGTSHDSSDTLLFVRPNATRDDRSQIEAALGPMFHGRVHSSERRLVAGGHRALLRLPLVVAQRVAATLERQGIPVKATAANWTWASAPLPVFALAMATVVVGAMASSTAPLLLWTSPPIAVLLLLLAQKKLQEPVVVPPRRHPIFPAEVEQRIAVTFAEMRPGLARRLLGALVRAAVPTYRSLEATRYPPVPTEQIDALLLYGCQAARDVADLDDHLGLLEDSPLIETHVADVRWMDGLIRAERLRDGLVQKFLHGIAVLQRLRTETSRSDPARALIEGLVTSIDESSRAHAEAIQEIEALLETPHAA